MSNSVPQANNYTYYSGSALKLLKGIDIEVNQLLFVLDFTLLWGLFEAKVAGKNTLGLKRLSDFLNTLNEENLQKSGVFESAFDKIMYFEEGSSQEGIISFSGVDSHRIELRMNHDLTNKNKDFAYDILALLKKNLEDNTLTILEKTKVLAYIAYRLRNNLFHGQKDLDYLWKQKALFNAINPVLLELNVIANILV